MSRGLKILVFKTQNTFNAQIAQSVEQGTENPRVGGSIPPLGTIRILKEASQSRGFFVSVPPTLYPYPIANQSPACSNARLLHIYKLHKNPDTLTRVTGICQSGLKGASSCHLYGLEIEGYQTASTLRINQIDCCTETTDHAFSPADSGEFKQEYTLG